MGTWDPLGYTLVVESSLYGYFGAHVYTISLGTCTRETQDRHGVRVRGFMRLGLGSKP